MIRRADGGDVGDLVAMGEKFHAYSPWRDVPFDAQAMAAVMANCAETGAIFRTDDGMCGGLLVPLYFNPAFSLAVELFWWAPSEGRALREAFEAWSRAAGAYGVQFSALGDEHLPAVTRMYRRAGFSPAETAFIKRF